MNIQTKGNALVLSVARRVDVGPCTYSRGARNQVDSLAGTELYKACTRQERVSCQRVPMR